MYDDYLDSETMHLINVEMRKQRNRASAAKCRQRHNERIPTRTSPSTGRPCA